MTEVSEMHLVQKLYEIRKKAYYIQKDSKGHKYSYANETSVLQILRPLLDEYRVLMTVGMLEPKPIKFQEKEFVKEGFQVGIDFSFINVDKPEQTIERTIYMQDVAGDPKKFGGILTYSVRFFLVKFFNIPTDEMDPDSFQNEITGKITEKQLHDLEARLRGKPGYIEKILEWANIDALADLPSEKLSSVLKRLQEKPNATS